MGTLVFLHDWSQDWSQMSWGGCLRWIGEREEVILWARQHLLQYNNMKCDWRLSLYCMLLREPVYETILFRRPCLDTHQPPTHSYTSPPTHSHTHTPFYSFNQLSGSVLGEKKAWEIYLPGLSSFYLSRAKTRHLSFHHSAGSSTLTSHSVSSARAYSEYSHSRLSPLASTCFEFDTCLPTPTHRQRKSQQVTLNSVHTCSPQYNRNTQQHSFRQWTSVHTPTAICRRGICEWATALTLALESLFPKAPADRRHTCEIWGIHNRYTHSETCDSTD